MNPLAAPLTRPLRAALVGLAAATALVAGATGQARAISWEPSLDYQEWAMGVPAYEHQVGVCTVSVGPVKDPSRVYPFYRKIAGVQIKCTTRVNRIDAYVALQKWEGGRWVQKGTQGYGVLFDSYGSGDLKKGSQPVCGGAGSSWRTLATVRLGSNGIWRDVWSAAATDPAGC